MLSSLKKILPTSVFRLYHYALAWLGQLIYRRPGRDLTVIGITGTKGKSTTTELVSALLEANGHTTALAGTIRFKIAKHSQPNLKKMTQPGRFFIQKFLRQAARAGCDIAVLELTSEGSKQFRHKWLELDALIFTNLSPEHIESHGSYENYREAKLDIARELNRSKKKQKTLIVNQDDPEHIHFLKTASDQVQTLTYSLQDLENSGLDQNGMRFNWQNQEFRSPLIGRFNLENILASLTLAVTVKKVPLKIAAEALAQFSLVPGRVEKVKVGQDFSVVVDYAHTPDSLEKLYQAFEGQHRICVLGNTGGGRDRWKRPVMGEIADRYCDEIILTNEDPYDEEPATIVREMKQAVQNTPCQIIMDRRAAIQQALRLANNSQEPAQTAVLITGKGTDPYIMEAAGRKTPWSDRRVTEAELSKLNL